MRGERFALILTTLFLPGLGGSTVVMASNCAEIAVASKASGECACQQAAGGAAACELDVNLHMERLRICPTQPCLLQAMLLTVQSLIGVGCTEESCKHLLRCHLRVENVDAALQAYTSTRLQAHGWRHEFEIRFKNALTMPFTHHPGHLECHP